MLVELVPHLQAVMLITGMVFSVYIAYRIGRQHTATESQTIRGLVPIATFLAVVTVAFLRLYLG